MEKKRFRRTDFETSGSFVGERGAVKVDPIDVSLKGAMGKPADAECVHREHEYFGFRFAMMDLDSMTHLRRLIELNTPDDGDLERELGFLIQR